MGAGIGVGGDIKIDLNKMSKKIEKAEKKHNKQKVKKISIFNRKNK